MKSKEEIEQLAKEEYKDYLNNPFFTAAPMGYIKGYTQCQEDMANEIDKAYKKGLEDGYACMPSVNSFMVQRT